MCQRWEAAAIAPLPLEIDLSGDAAVAPRQTVQHAAPVIDDHAVAVGLAAAGMESGLRRRDDPAQVLDRAGAQQRLPVRPARRLGEGGGYHQELRAVGAELAK